MGGSTDADGERERARASPSDSLDRRVDKRCFIDAIALESRAVYELSQNRREHCLKTVAHDTALPVASRDEA